MPNRPVTAASSGSVHEALEEVRFRARMARVGPDATNRAERRSRPPVRGRGFRLGWKGWLVVDCLIVLLVVAGVVAWPPVQTCRQQDRTVGVFEGDSVDRCIRRGIASRFDTADQRFKSLIRGLGR
jgi:hypothetical protein